MIRKAFAVAGNELLIVFKDRGALAILFLLPIVLSSVFGSLSTSMMEAVEGERVISLPVAVVNQDDGVYAQQIADILDDIEVLELSSLDKPEQAHQAVADGKALAAIVIPAGFSAGVDTHQPTRIQVIVDPTQEQYSSLITGIMNDVVKPVVLQGEIQYGIRSVMDRSGLFANVAPEIQAAVQAQSMGAIMTQLGKQQSSPWIAVRSEDLAGVEAKGPWNPFMYTTPGFAVMFAFFLVPTVAKSLWDEKESGTFRRLLASPLPRASILGGKMLAYMLVACLQMLLFFTIANTVFHMPLGQSALGLVLTTVVLSIVPASLGLLVAAVVRNGRQAESLGMVLGFILAAAGGCIGYPLFRSEGLLGTISRLTPHANALMAYMSLFDGAGLAVVLPQIAILAGMGVLLLGLAVWRFRFE